MSNAIEKVILYLYSKVTSGNYYIFPIECVLPLGKHNSHIYRKQPWCCHKRNHFEHLHVVEGSQQALIHRIALGF